MSSLPIEAYALIGDTRTAALVGRDGSIDWFCAPRFDSGAMFAGLLGDRSHGRWRLTPAGGASTTQRRYRPGTLVLETEFEVEGGSVRVVDLMPIGANASHIVRSVEGLRGRVTMELDLTFRFDGGAECPG